MKYIKNNLYAISGRKGSGKDEVGIIIQYLYYRELWLIHHHANPPTEVPITETNYHIFKDSLARNNTPWKTKKFADKLKDIVCLLIGCTREQLEDRYFKETPLDSSWSKWTVESTTTSAGKLYTNTEHFDALFEANDALEDFHAHGDDAWLHERKLTPRVLLQILGTDAMRNVVHPNVWVNSTMGEYDKECKEEMSNAIKRLPETVSTAEKAAERKVQAHLKKLHLGKPMWIITDCRFPDEVDAVENRGGTVIRIERGERLENQHISETALDDEFFEHVIQNNGSILDLINEVYKIIF